MAVAGDGAPGCEHRAETAAGQQPVNCGPNRTKPAENQGVRKGDINDSYYPSVRESGLGRKSLPD